MEMPKPIANIIAHANAIDAVGVERVFTVDAMIVTPTEQIPLLIPNGFACLSLFGPAHGGGISHSDNARIKAQIQPGVYMRKVLPSKDNLFIEVTERVGITQIMRRWRAVPLGDANPEMQGGNSSLADLSTKDETNMITVTFQLFETGYALLRNELVADTLLMTTLKDLLHGILTQYGSNLSLTGADAFKGVNIEEPVDNARVFSHVAIPAAVPLVKLAMWLQEHDEFGFYSTGLGCYYRKGMWWIYPLYRTGRYEKAPKVLNVYRVPEDVIPSLKRSYYLEGKVLTVLSTGGGATKDGSDIKKQNVGTGKRIITADAAMAETGVYYNKGQAMTTRADSLSEYQTSKRASGEEMMAYHAEPTNNICKHLSENARNDGNLVQVAWHNSDASLIEPGMAVRYFYMSGSNNLVYKEGTVHFIKSEWQMDTQSAGQPTFREKALLGLFISDDEVPAE
jgi:hypothetical protein